ncbi:uroporphyrinogen-III C-methyltransferase [uncultured Umboniibacter sp.]|uniref:uroporphyrinogen-III C-methyltransferase n=1 Tax=uncultured Umboniibacter sp. TaxID=1798917 RepID=UPI0026222434|nr:uroporphyrinogen-III C-methyltransferase [uncultured Umboniibacter sp.]
MSDKLTAEKVQAEEPQKKAVEAKQQKPAKEAKATSRGSLLARFNLLMIIIVALFVFWVWQERFVEHQAITAEIHQVEASNEVLRSQLDGAEKTLDILADRQTQLERALDDLTVLQEQINRVESDLKGVSSADRLVWQLEELEFLLRMARERILLSNDVQGARALLGSADRQLQEINNLDLQPVRAALARDLMAVNAAAEIDTAGVFARVRALSSVIEYLELKPEILVAEQSEPELSADISTFDRIIALVDIREFDRSVSPILAPEERYFVSRNLELMLEESLLALLQQNESLWRANLERADSWLQLHFSDSPERRAFSTELLALRQQAISISQLDIGAAEEALQRFRLGAQQDTEEQSP